MTQQELDQLQAKALEQFKTGKPLFGEGEAFAPMLKGFLEAALQAKMDGHINSKEREAGNKRNDKATKTVKSSQITDRIISEVKAW